MLSIIFLFNARQQRRFNPLLNIFYLLKNHLVATIDPAKTT